jgi:protein gp37
MRIAARFSQAGKPYAGLATQVNGHPRWTNKVSIVPEALELPYTWKKPRKVFVDSMSDLFHEQVPLAFVFAVFTVIEATPRHTYQVLTKRPERMREAVLAWLVHQGRSEPARNLWLGVSVEDQQRAEERIPVLLETPAAVRFLSCEPLLGPLNLAPWLTRMTARYPGDGSVEIREYETLDWVIVGGESGAGYRAMAPEWLWDLAYAAVGADVPTFVKQDAGFHPGRQGRIPDHVWRLKQFPRLAVPA